MLVNECEERTGHKIHWTLIPELQWQRISVSYPNNYFNLSYALRKAERSILDFVFQPGFFARPESEKGHILHIYIHSYSISKATDSSSNSNTS